VSVLRQDAQVVEIPLWVDLLAVFAAGVAASILATKREFDITGIILLTIVAALGGGIIRDTLIQRGTPAALQHSSYLLVAFAAAGVGFFFARRAESMDSLLTVVDAASLGLYTLVGVLKGFAADLPIPSVLLVGVLSTTGGGILRDVMMSRTPVILLPGAPYAVLSLIGGLIAVALHEAGATQSWLWWIPVIVVVSLRLMALRFGWQTPLAFDLESRVRSVRPWASTRLRRRRRSRKAEASTEVEDRDVDK
jgi:uncharacterized membrane protein YeiH